MKKLLFVTGVALLLEGCIGTDEIADAVQERVSIENVMIEIKVGESHQFTATYFDNTGNPVNADVNWTSSDPTVISITTDGLATAESLGESTITAEANGISESLLIATNETGSTASTQRTAMLKTTSTYPLDGTATLSINGGATILQFSEDFATTPVLPGLFVYLTNNPTTINGALEIGEVAEFTGAQTYAVPGDIDLFTYNFVLFYCKPFVVPVGQGELEP